MTCLQTVRAGGSGHQYRGAMAHITGHIRIAVPIDRVFDTIADSRNEPSFNPAMTGVELLTPPPIGLGTRFRARMGKAGMEMLVELTEFDRPHRLGSRTTSSMMETSGTLTFAAEDEGTIMSWDWQVRPKGWLRMLGPLSGPLGGRMERRIWTGLKHQLEDDASTHPA
jgi:carbon monoxide dehydrogenase subunit G